MKLLYSRHPLLSNDEIHTEIFSKMYFAYYSNLTKAINKYSTKSGKKSLKILEETLDHEFFERTKAFIELHSKNKSKFTFHSDELDFKQKNLNKESIIFDKSIIKGINSERTKNGNIEDYNYYDEHAYGVKFYHHK